MTRLRIIVVRALLALGWLSLLTGAALFGLEQTGLAQRFVLDLLAARAGVIGNSLTVESVDFRWTEPGIVLRGVSLSDADELLAADRLHIAFGFRLRDGFSLRRLEFDRGRIRLGRALWDGLSGLLDLGPGGTPAPLSEPKRAQLPDVEVRSLRISVDAPGGGSHALGELDLSIAGGALSRDVGAPAVRGRLRLSGGAPSEYTPAIDLVGGLDAEGLVDVRASAVGLPLAELARLEPASLAALRARAITGELTLAGQWKIDLARVRPIAGTLRLALRDAALAPAGDEHRIEAIALDLDARFDPGADARATPLSPSAWSGAARFDGRWAGQRLRGAARLGSSARPEALVEAWMRLPELELTRELVELFGAPQWLQNPYAATRPEGRFDVGFGIRWRSVWQPGEPIDPHLEYTATARNVTGIRARWLGIPVEAGEPRVAFPLAATVDDLAVVYARTRRLQRPELLGVAARGAHHAGPMSVSYAAWSPPIDAVRAGGSEEELRITSPRVAIDAELAQAMAALESAPAVQQIFPTFGPAQGTVAVDLRLSNRRELPEMATLLKVELDGIAARWRELPVAASDIAGELVYAADGRGVAIVGVRIAGALPSARRLELRGRVRDERPPGRRREPQRATLTALEVFQLEVRELSLTGVDRAAVGRKWPGIAAALDRFGAAGSVDLRFLRGRSAADASVETVLDVRPLEDVVLTPPELPLPIRDVTGRVLTLGSERAAEADGGAEPSSTWRTAVAPLAGTWPGDARVAMSALFPDDAPSSLRVYGAGLRLGDPELRARLTGPAAPEEMRLIGGSVEDFQLSGGLDFASELSPDTGSEGEERHAIRLRRNDLAGPAGLRLAELEGELVIDGQGLSSAALNGQLGPTPFDLTDARLVFGANERRLEATVRARDVPLDRTHLGLFLDPLTLDALIDEFGWRGRIDVPAWRLEWSESDEQGATLRLSGPLTLTDVRLEIGVPLSIGSASGHIHELVIENDSVRALGELTDMYGELMGRELGPARVLASHYGTRMNIDVLEGTFVRGSIRGLDQELEGSQPHLRPAPVFSMEMVPPFPFQLALELEDVDVGEFLTGLFSSNITDRGRLSAELRLFGDIDDVLSIRGAGHGDLRDARLWSIPVFRDLFSQLGIAETAIFDRMRTRFTLEEGLIEMRDIEVRSPLLRLAGHGTLDLDGTLEHDFEVRYGVVDRLGILRQLVYAVQNVLLSVSIRGDMSRPVVILRSALTALFRPVSGDQRSLPMPGYSPLPPRF